MIYKKDAPFLLLLLILPFFFLVFFGRFGFEDSDSGFLVGMGWRILNGELPYKDFYYVRPAASPLISAFWLAVLPEFGQVIMMRLINYYLLMLQVCLTIVALSKYYDFKELKLNVYILAFVSFLITSTGTLNFQWHTTDGVIFAVLGFFVIAQFKHRNFIYLILAGSLLGASALTKQNFMLVPLLEVFFVCLQHGHKKAFFVLIGILITLLSFYLYLLNNGLLTLYLDQTTGATNAKDLFAAGVTAYFAGDDYILVFVAVTFGLFMFLLYFARSYSNLWGKLFISSIFVLVFINLSAFLYLKKSARLIEFDHFIPVLLTSAFIYVLVFKREAIKDHYFLIALVGISWSASISWGGMTPLMYFTPIIFASYYLMQKYLHVFDKKINATFVVLIVFYSVIANTKPYRDNFVWSISNDASEISEKLAFIKANDTVFNKHLELKRVFEKYHNTTILPSMPGAYYIHGQRNAFSIDWAMDVEAAFDRKGLIEKLEKCCSYYIIEKKALGQPIGDSGKFYSSITDYALKNYKLIDSSFEYFDIYSK